MALHGRSTWEEQWSFVVESVEGKEISLIRASPKPLLD